MIAPGVKLWDDAVTDTFAILAKRGTGKTYAASVMAEEFLKRRQPIVVYDPLGAWWGLKSSADGTSDGFPVVIFGGKHADIPLEATAGETIAKTIVEKRFPAILDCSLLRKGARVRFMADFCEALYHFNTLALHFFADEVHTIAPQNLKQSQIDVARCLGAIEDIILQGRVKGLGMTAISQRPALVNTNVRSQCATLVAMRVIGKHDRKAILEWVDVKDEKKQAAEMLDSLASLPLGDAWIWNPELSPPLFKHIHFRERQTFDSSATPKPGKSLAPPKKIAQIDLQALGDAIRATIEKAKADDPKILRSKIAELEKQLGAKSLKKLQEANRQLREELAAKPKPTQAKVWRPQPTVDVGATVAAQMQKRDQQWESAVAPLEEAASRWQTCLRAIHSSDSAGRAIQQLITAAKPTGDAKVKRPGGVGKVSPIVRQPPAQAAPAQPAPEQKAPAHQPVAKHVRPPSADGQSLDAGMRAILKVIVQFDDADRHMIHVSTGYKDRSQTTYLSRLRMAGYIEAGSSPYRATPEGIAALGDFDPLPTGADLQAYWLDGNEIGAGEKEILRLAIAAHPNCVGRAEVLSQTGKQERSLTTYLSRLRGRRLVTTGREGIRASDNLF